MNQSDPETIQKSTAPQQTSLEILMSGKVYRQFKEHFINCQSREHQRERVPVNFHRSAASMQNLSVS